MRSLCWCSALACLLVACGGAPRASPSPFAYDASAPLAVHVGGLFAWSAQLHIEKLTYAGVNGTRVQAYLAVPLHRTGRLPAVLFLHGSGGSRADLVVAAAKLALRGAVTMTITEPQSVLFRPYIVDARRALDLLVARPDVDASRLGVVGFSLGAQLAAILAGADPRPKAVGIVAGRGSRTPLYWIRRSHADLFFQAGTKDDHIPHVELVALIKAAPGKPKVRWYPVAHVWSAQIEADQLNWQARELGLG